MTEQEIKELAEKAAKSLYEALISNKPITIVLKSTCSEPPESEVEV